MTRTPNTDISWRVQVRKSRDHKWQNKGLFETRDAARYEAGCLRDGYCGPTGFHDGLGYGNTRVVRHVKGQK